MKLTTTTTAKAETKYRMEFNLINYFPCLWCLCLVNIEPKRKRKFSCTALPNLSHLLKRISLWQFIYFLKFKKKKSSRRQRLWWRRSLALLYMCIHFQLTNSLILISAVKMHSTCVSIRGDWEKRTHKHISIGAHRIAFSSHFKSFV